MFKFLTRGLMLAAMLLTPAVATAQAYPEKAVTVVIPFSAGGSNDTIGRYLAASLSKMWGKPFVVENRAGGGTAVGSAHVANTDPDGYNLLFVSGSYVINAASRSDLPFDPIKDLVPVSLVATADIGVISGPRTKIMTLDDLIREAKGKDIFYATAGVGSQQHFYAALLAELLGIKMTAVPYPGGAEGLLDLLGGRVDLVVGTVSGMLATIQNGATPVAIMSEARTASLPNVPTAKELGYPDATTQTFWAVFVPDGTPADVVAKLHDGISATFTSTEGAEFLKSLDAKPGTMSVEEVQKFIPAEIAHWTELAKKFGIVAK